MKQDLFTSGAELDGVAYRIFRIPGIVTTGLSQTLLACAEARQLPMDQDPMDIVLRRSTDGGETWGAPVKLRDGVSTGDTMNNPLLIAEPDSDTVHLLCSKNYRQIFYLRSRDAGATWSAPRELTPALSRAQYPWTWIAAGPGHGITLKNGRLLAPVWLADRPDDQINDETAISTLYSDDGGETWALGDVVMRHGQIIDGERAVHPAEPTVAQRADGSVIINIRTYIGEGERKGVRLVHTSPDGVSHWSAGRYDRALTDPNCFASLLAYGEDTLLFLNDGHPSKRLDLTLWASRDGGETWPVSAVLEEGSVAYPDLACGRDGALYLLYERERYNFITLQKLTAAQVSALLGPLSAR